MNSPADPYDAKRHEKQARELVPAARIAALVQYPSFVALFPCLVAVDSLKLGLIVGVVGVVVGVERLVTSKFGPGHKEELLGIILYELGKEGESVDAFRECQRVVQKNARRLGAAGHQAGHSVADALGIWIACNLFDKEKPDAVELESAQAIGRITAGNFENWWTTGIAPGLGEMVQLNNTSLPHFQYGRYEGVEELLAKRMTAEGREHESFQGSMFPSMPDTSLESIRCYVERVLGSRQGEGSGSNGDLSAKSPDHLVRQSQDLVPAACLLGNSMYAPMVRAFPCMNDVDVRLWQEAAMIAGVLTGIGYLRLQRLDRGRQRELLGNVAPDLQMSPTADLGTLYECESIVLALAERLEGAGLPERLLLEYALGDWIACRVFGKPELSQDELHAGRAMAVTAIEFFEDWWGEGRAE